MFGKSASLVDVATVSDGMDDDSVIGLEDFENDAMRAFPEFVQTAELAFEWEQFCGVQVGREPFKPVDDARGNVEIKLFKLLGRGLEESDGVQLQAEPLANGTQLNTTFASDDCFFLANKPLVHGFFHRQTFVWIPKQLDEFLFDGA